MGRSISVSRGLFGQSGGGEKVNIGDDVMIAPNSFVNIDIPSHSVVFGSPCIIKHRNWATEGYVNNIVE